MFFRNWRNGQTGFATRVFRVVPELRSASSLSFGRSARSTTRRKHGPHSNELNLVRRNRCCKNPGRTNRRLGWCRRFQFIPRARHCNAEKGWRSAWRMRRGEFQTAIFALELPPCAHNSMPAFVPLKCLLVAPPDACLHNLNDQRRNVLATKFNGNALLI
jgi:hypothetical protein